MSLALKIVARFQVRNAVAKPFDAMLEALEPSGGELDYSTIKKFASEFAKNLVGLKGQLVRPSAVQKAARDAATAVESPTKRLFNVMALQLGAMVADAWKRAHSVGGGNAFVEGMQDTLRRRAPMSDRDWIDAIEYGLGYAEGELGVRI